MPSLSDYVVGVSGLVGQWMCNLIPNYGFKLQLVTESYYRRVSFSTREYADAANHPVLECQFASISAIGPANACGNYTLNGILSNAEFPDVYHFEWTHLNSSTVFHGQNYVNPPTVSGINTYVLTVSNDYCQSAVDTVSVIVGGIDYNIVNSYSFCNSSSEIIDLGINNVDYLWSDGSSAQTITVTESGFFIVTISDSFGCESIESISVAFSNMNINIASENVSCYSANDGELYAGNYIVTIVDNNDGSIEFVVTGGNSPYRFVLNDSIYFNSYIDSLQAGIYSFVIFDDHNCELLVNNISLFDNPNNNCIEIPNAFTHNSDGINDTWIIENIWRYPEAKIQIFNR